jgi:hypothetical protein
MIKEMNMDMACPEACFQAGTADECFAQIQRWMLDGTLFRKISFRSAVESLCKENMSLDMHRTLAGLGILNLFAMTSGEDSLG